MNAGWVTGGGAVQLLAWGLAGATAIVCYRSEHGLIRFVIGLWAGVLSAHLGWALLHIEAVLDAPLWLLEPGAASVLFFPLGVLLVTRSIEALAALPLALAVARLGCLPFDCCYASAWAALPELAALAALHLAARSWPSLTPLLVLSGIGLVRLLSEPLRQPSGDLFLAVEWIALSWVAAGISLRNRLSPADATPDWDLSQHAPLLRALAVMLAVWLFPPIALWLFETPPTALLAAALASLAFVVATRTQRPAPPRVPAIPALAAGLCTGMVAAAAFVKIAQTLWMFPPLAGSYVTAKAAPLDLRSLIAVVILAPVYEEFLYRERVLGALKGSLGVPAAVLLSSALFALSHTQTGAMPGAFLLGLVNAALVLRWQSMSLAVGVHAGANFALLRVLSP